MKPIMLCMIFFGMGVGISSIAWFLVAKSILRSWGHTIDEWDKERNLYLRKYKND